MVINMKTTIEIDQSFRLVKDNILFLGGGPNGEKPLLVTAVAGSTVTVIKFRWYHKIYFRVLRLFKLHTRPRFH